MMCEDILIFNCCENMLSRMRLAFSCVYPGLSFVKLARYLDTVHGVTRRQKKRQRIRTFGDLDTKLEVLTKSIKNQWNFHGEL